MPTYTYRCSNCDFHFDLHARFGEPAPDKCPNCDAEGQIQRVYKPVGVVFKGSGFYATDNKSGSVLPANGKDSGTSDKDSSGSKKSGSEDSSSSSSSDSDSKKNSSSTKPATNSSTPASPAADA